MGVKNIVRRVGEKAGDKVAQLSKLSPAQIVDIQAKREEYLLQMPNPNDEVAKNLTEKMMAASSIEVFNAFLPQIKELYLPLILILIFVILILPNGLLIKRKIILKN